MVESSAFVAMDHQRARIHKGCVTLPYRLACKRRRLDS
jgi:hypothetical protein